jgi:hypothetical protein
MLRYSFALDDDLPWSGAAEELANDTIASNVATLIAGELSRNRYGGDQVAVSSSTNAARSFTRFGPVLSMTLGGAGSGADARQSRRI